MRAKDAGKPSEWDGDILVPFAIEAPLSGVGRRLKPTEALWYRRSIELKKANDERTLLHFEAVDYDSEVWVNPIFRNLNFSHTGGCAPGHASSCYAHDVYMVRKPVGLRSVPLWLAGGDLSVDPTNERHVDH